MTPVADASTPRRRAGRIVFWVIFGAAAACVVASILWGGPPSRIYTDPSPSMENGIQPGDKLLVAPGHDVRRGDVVVLEHAGELLVRRAIGIPGDLVACCDPNGRVVVDGKSLDESYVHPGDKPSGKTFFLTLGKGQLWVLGDHRSIAIDSRVWGPVPAVSVVGRVADITRGLSTHAVLTPQTFISSGLAPPDDRTPAAFVRSILRFFGLLTLLVLTVLGITRTLIRRRRRRHSLREATAAQ
jgi:signal peptidase I